MQPRSKVELFAAIRRDARIEKLSIHELSRRYGVHRRLVREALTSPWPAGRKAMPPRRSVVDPYKPIIDAILRTDLDAPRKQRHTAKRVFDRLVAEHGMDNVSYGRIRDYIKRRKPEILIEEGRGPPTVFVAQTHRPGEEARSTSGTSTSCSAGCVRCATYSSSGSPSPARPSTASSFPKHRRPFRRSRARLPTTGRRATRQGAL